MLTSNRELINTQLKTEKKNTKKKKRYEFAGTVCQ